MIIVWAFILYLGTLPLQIESSFKLYKQYELGTPVTPADQIPQKQLNKFSLPEMVVTNISAGDMKLKLLSSIQKYKKEIEDKMGTLHKLHFENRLNKKYRLGYIVSYIDKEYTGILNLIQKFYKNIHSWPVSKMWKVYDQLRKGTKQVRDLLKKVSEKAPNVEEIVKTPLNKGSSYDQDIAWSYYDADHYV